MKEQEAMEKFFPNWMDYPNNSLIPTITSNLQNERKFIFLFRGDKKNLYYLVHDNNKNTKVGTALYTQERGDIVDLVIRFKFKLKTGDTIMETIISGEDELRMENIIRTLKNIDIFYFFIANEKFKLKQLREINFTPESHAILK